VIDGGAAAYILLLGMVAAFNPCGFALLPAYLTVIVTGSADAQVSRAQGTLHALSFALAMTLGFVAVFTAFGLLFVGVDYALQGSILPYASYVTAVVGVVLVALGVMMASGKEIRGPGMRFAGTAPGRAFASRVAYGATFAIASMSCTIAPFFVVVTAGLAATSPVGVVSPFVVYAVGMGTAVVLVSLIAALAGAGVAAAFRRHTGLIMRIGGALMIVAGLYVLLFGLAEVLPQYGIRALDPVLLWMGPWQSVANMAIGGWGTPVLVGLAVLAAVASALVIVGARRAKRETADLHLP
jgi:cytochrome c biogenesis protein CcdA